MMNKMMRRVLYVMLIMTTQLPATAQTIVTTPSQEGDSLNVLMLHEYRKKAEVAETRRLADSMYKADLENRLVKLKDTDNKEKDKILEQLNSLQQKEALRLAEKKRQIDSLKLAGTGYAVMGLLQDTLFVLYTRIGSYTAAERAAIITKRIRDVYEDREARGGRAKTDSLRLVAVPDAPADIMYHDRIVMSVSETDALWNGTTTEVLAQNYRRAINDALDRAAQEKSLSTLLMRSALVLLVLIAVGILIYVVNFLYRIWLRYTAKRKDKWLRDLSYKDYTFLTAEQEYGVLLLTFRCVRWLVIGLLLYMVIPMVFSIFPFTQGWADKLFDLIWHPLRNIILSVWNYLPKVFTILVICIVMRYVVRLTKYIFHEIETGKLRINGFHSDWAEPTYSIVRFLLYAFMFVIIFRYLPYADSDVFKGVSVFIGVLFSLGSSSAIGNIVAGLVITYMRPFKIGDKIKIGEITGEVTEKTLLVTRLRTIGNEEVTIPNSSVLSGNTINYSAFAMTQGLIVHTTVSIGYDTPWTQVHAALKEAAMRSDLILNDPEPFVLQKSLDDFYVSYELGAYTRAANQQAGVYSQLHQHIQDVCRERGIEIMSPHYRAHRDGNASTIPTAPPSQPEEK